MTSFYIDPVARSKIVTKWVVITLWFLHGWATLDLIAGYFFGVDKDLIIAIFRTCTFGIGLTLGILLLDRAADAILSKFASSTLPTTAITETITRTTVPAATAPVNDVTMKVEGDVNVNPSK